jgi:hypothetical protein
VGDVLDIFSKAAHAPKMNLFVNAALLGFIPKSVKKGLMALAPVRRIRNAVMKDLGLPEDMLTFVNYPTRFDCRETLTRAQGQRHRMPQPARLRLALWDYWERHLDPDLFIDRSLRARWAARWCWSPAARRASAWRRRTSSPRPAPSRSSAAATRTSWTRPARRSEARAMARFRWPTAVDIADMADCDRVRQAAASTARRRRLPDQQRRPLDPPRHRVSYDRFHDFERTMQLNYFGCLRVTMGLLPGMVAKKRKGHVVNISSIGVLTNAPRFSAYVASKAALDAWTRCASQRVRRPGHHLHHHQHAAGAHADDRADQDLQQRAHAGPKRRPT